MLIKIENLKKYYGDKLILDIERLNLFEGDKAGLIGKNGAGKTTLLKIMLGEIDDYEGYVYLKNSYSYINQSEICDNNKDYKSGGEKVKLKISKALSENRSLIIADEPTTNLDRKSIENLESMFIEFNGSLLVVSHDRAFLDSFCNIIFELSETKIKKYDGNYSKYKKLKEEEIKTSEREYEKYISEKTRIYNAINGKKEKRNSMKNTPNRMGNSESRLHKLGNQKAEKNIDNSIKALKSRFEKLEEKEKPKEEKNIYIYVHESLKLSSKHPIIVNSLNLYGGEKLLIKNASFSIKKGTKVGLLGANGSGKTTLIKKILENNDENIKISKSVVFGYFDQNQYILHEDKNILLNASENSSLSQSFIRTLLSTFGFKGDEVYRSISSISGGERIKLALCKVLLEDNNFLIIDEPTNFLDILSINALENALLKTEKNILLVSHDREFLSTMCDEFLIINDKCLTSFKGSYDEFVCENNKTVDNQELKNMILIKEAKLSNILTKLSYETNDENKNKLDIEYKVLLDEIKKIKRNL